MRILMLRYLICITNCMYIKKEKEKGKEKVGDGESKGWGESVKLQNFTFLNKGKCDLRGLPGRCKVVMDVEGGDWRYCKSREYNDFRLPGVSAQFTSWLHSPYVLFTNKKIKIYQNCWRILNERILYEGAKAILSKYRVSHSSPLFSPFISRVR
jgi:hypothetical protein